MFIRRFAAIATIALLTAGNLIACGGWGPTPEARMACCTNGAGCPMHAGSAHSSADVRILTQADADRCCAGASDRTSSNDSHPTSFVTGAATLHLIPALIAPVQTPALRSWRVFAPHPVSSVPLHLLHTVLLV